jgi:multicomponent Na+:H+ antiporter subunit B
MRISGHEARDRIPQTDVILETTVRLMIPFIQLYGLYVIVHGHYSPGGGFQGGVVLGASVILLALASGLPASKKYLAEGTSIILANAGALIFTGIALYDPVMMLAGAIPTSLLAITVDALVATVAFLVVPRGVNPARA